MLGIVVSRADSASVHIGEQLRALADWESYEDDGQPAAEGGGTVYETAGAELREFETRHLDLVEPAAAFGDIDLLVFASKHSGETGPLLTAHHTGNIGTAVHGGADHSLAEPAPHALRTVYELLADHAPSGYDVGIECTHHGPSNVGAPSMFVEVGSAQPQWDDPEAARGVAQAILDLRDVVPHCPTDNGNETRRQLLGIGGGHYAPRFERIIQETDWTVGHILADWGLDEADIDTATLTAVLEQAFEAGKTAYALVEDDRPEVLDRIEALGYRAVSETWVRETEGVPLGLVGDLESTVCPVEDGLRFGDAARGDSVPDTYDVVELPTALVDEARGIDRAQMSDELVATTLAFTTDQGGSRPTGTVVLDDETTQDAVVDRLVSLLETKYDTIEREADAIVARRTVFNPEKARTLGVPDGPAFGKLADGTPVDVGGETIPPDAVHDEHVDEFSLSS